MLQVLIAISQKFCCKEEAFNYAKVIHKKRRKKSWKNGQVSKILKTMGTQMPTWKKREMNKIAHVFLQKYFQVFKERYVFKEHSRIRLATIYIQSTTYIYTHAHLDLIVWLNPLWIQGLTLQYMYYKFALSCFFHFYELHISLSCRKRKE
jgi:hypothetical protein